jgi:hypothetical protein
MLQIYVCDVVFYGHVYHPFYIVIKLIAIQKKEKCSKITFENEPYAMDKKLYLSILNYFQ